MIVVQCEISGQIVRHADERLDDFPEGGPRGFDRWTGHAQATGTAPGLADQGGFHRENLGKGSPSGNLQITI
jgi:hypothetical protein